MVLVLFGAKALPKFARGIGQAKKEFKKGLEEGEAEDDKAGETGEKPARTKEPHKVRKN